MSQKVRVILKRGEEKDVYKGHLWIYDNEIARIDGEFTPGSIVDVHSFSGEFLGRGYINPKSKITVRLLTTEDEPIDRKFIQKRLTDAFRYRELLGLKNSYRAFFGDADRLPALVIDKFNDCFVIQTLALGIDMMKDDIVSVIRDYYHPRCIYERNDVPLREKEGMKQQKGVLCGEEPGIVQIEENGIKIFVDVVNGQKTGYFLDQRENRAAIQPFCPGADVLDCFCHTGGFALNAAAFGASSVEAVDVSQEALDFVRKNAAANHFGCITAKNANVFDLLKAYEADGRVFDTVILDPPAFCKTKSALPGAIRGYKEINLRAMKLIKPHGFLVTCSCSHFMTPNLFLDMLQDAAADVRKNVKITEIRYQAKDHPIPVNADESLYLKCVMLQIS